MSSLVLRNGRMTGHEGLTDIAVSDGTITAIGPQLPGVDGARELDVGGGLVRPPFVEPHLHLDSALVLGKKYRNESGTLWEGIQLWGQIRSDLTYDDVVARAEEVLRWQVAQGTLFVRGHVDCGDPDLTAMRALIDLRDRVRDVIEVQLVAFPQQGLVSMPHGVELMKQALELGADCVGGIPHYEDTREDAVRALQIAFDFAQEYGRLVDIHCDEIDDEVSRAIEVVASLAHRTGLRSRATASHTTAMGSYNGAYANKILTLARRADLNFVSNPLVNITLQGRFDDYPKRRGLTRVKELWRAGVNVAFGHDDIIDPWYPIGTGNPLDVAHMGVHAAHMTAPDEIDETLEMVSARGATALSLGDRYGVREGRPGSCVVFDAEDSFDVIRRRPRPRWVIAKGKVVASTEPAHTELFWPEPHSVDFRQPGPAKSLSAAASP